VTLTKRTALALTSIMALLLSIVAMIQVVKLAEANPLPLMYLPTKPDTSELKIAIQSPSQNQRYNSNDIAVNFTVTKPESWFGNETSYGSTLPVVYYCNGEIVYVQYTLSGKSYNVSVNDDKATLQYNLPFQRTLNFSLNLSLPEGEYVIGVHAVALAYYMPTENWNPNVHGGVVSSEANEVVGDSTEITFFVFDTEKQALILPSVTFTVFAVASVGGAGLLLYFKKKGKKP